MADESNSDVLVAGGGVVGLTAAVVLGGDDGDDAERRRAAESGGQVRIRAREAAERTTWAVAGGLWRPYRIAPEELVGEWALVSLAVHEELAIAARRDGRTHGRGRTRRDRAGRAG